MSIITIVLIALLAISVYLNFELSSIAKELKERLEAYGEFDLFERVESDN